MKFDNKICIISLILLGVVFSQFVTPSSVYAAGISVTTLVDEDTANGVCSLREAIVAANTDAAYNGCTAGAGTDNITFSVSGTITLVSTLPTITTSLNINGGGLITISGVGSFRLFLVNVNPVTLGITRLTLSNGGLVGGTGGGAIFTIAGVTVNITDSTFSNNSSGTSSQGGGAIYNQGTLNITGSTFSQNTAAGAGTDGGAILSTSATSVVNITNSTFFGNSSGVGPLFTGSVGGAISIRVNSTGPNIITHVTLSNNTNESAFGALDIVDSSATVTNSILANTVTGFDCTKRLTGTFTSTNNIIETTDPGNPCSSASILDPGLGALQNNGGSTQTMAITSASPAYNFTATCPLAVDQRGISRPQPAGGNCDIGAFELADTTPPTVNIVSVSPNPTSTGTTVTWNANENGTFSVRVGGTNCTDGTVAASGNYVTSPANVASAIVAGDLAAGLNNLRVCVTDAATNQGSTTGTVIVDTGFPTVTASTPANSASVTGPTQLTVTFSEDISAITGNSAVNYLLLNDNGDGFDDVPTVTTCLTGINPNGGNDLNIPVDTATYPGGSPFLATLGINGGVALPVGTYRLYVCGTTSIEDLAGNVLNNGLNDTIINFTVIPGAAGGGGGGNARASLIPATGFPQGEITSLPIQPAYKAYAATDLWLEIPKLNIKMSIVGVPQTKDGWDIQWLGRDAGWLNGSAYPTWSGNSVITGHVWDALNKPGPFALLKNLKYGDQVTIHAFGQVFTYEIRETSLVLPKNISSMLTHEEKSWLTLITCETFNEKLQSYSYRRMVRAVLVRVTAEK